MVKLCNFDFVLLFAKLFGGFPKIELNSTWIVLRLCITKWRRSYWDFFTKWTVHGASCRRNERVESLASKTCIQSLLIWIVCRMPSLFCTLAFVGIRERLLTDISVSCFICVYSMHSRRLCIVMLYVCVHANTLRSVLLKLCIFWEYLLDWEQTIWFTICSYTYVSNLKWAKGAPSSVFPLI